MFLKSKLGTNVIEKTETNTKSDAGLSGGRRRRSRFFIRNGTGRSQKPIRVSAGTGSERSSCVSGRSQRRRARRRNPIAVTFDDAISKNKMFLNLKNKIIFTVGI